MADPTPKDLADQLSRLIARVDAGVAVVKQLEDRIAAIETADKAISPSVSEDAISGALEVLASLAQLARDALASQPLSPTSTGWRRVHDACASAIGGDELAAAIPAPRGAQTPMMVPRGEVRGEPVPPLAKRGAQPAPSRRPDLGGTGGNVLAPPSVQTGAQRAPQTGTAGAGDIRSRPDVAAELDRIKKR
jgi:hypothetical protein